jgi:hypothetical protein
VDESLNHNVEITHAHNFVANYFYTSITRAAQSYNARLW